MNQQIHPVAILLGKVGEEILPEAKALFFKTSGSSFQVDFLFSKDIDSTILAHIEARLRMLVRKKEPIEVKTYVTSNAVSFLLASKQHELAEIAQEMDSQFIDLVVYDSWITYCPNVCVEAVTDTIELQLIEKESFVFPLGPMKDRRVLAIRGLFAKTKKELVTKVKSFKQKRPVEPILESKQLLSLYDDRALFLEQGRQVLSFCQMLWEQEMEAICAPVISFPLDEPKELFEIMKKRGLTKLAWWGIRKEVSEDFRDGFFSVSDPVSDLLYVELSKEEAISHLSKALQFIRKIYTLFGLSCAFTLYVGKSGATLMQEVLLSLGFPFERKEGGKAFQTQVVASFCDRLGREFELSSLTIKKEEGNKIVVAESVFLSVERTIALAVEWNLDFHLSEVKNLFVGEEKNFESQ